MEIATVSQGWHIGDGDCEWKESLLQAERGEHVVEVGDHEDPVGGQEVPRPSARS